MNIHQLILPVACAAGLPAPAENRGFRYKCGSGLTS